jgi:hypothetical protein
LKYKYWAETISNSRVIVQCLAAGELSEEATCKRHNASGVCPYWHRVDIGSVEYDVCGYPIKRKRK